MPPTKIRSPNDPRLGSVAPALLPQMPVQKLPIHELTRVEVRQAFSQAQADSELDLSEPPAMVLSEFIESHIDTGRQTLACCRKRRG